MARRPAFGALISEPPAIDNANSRLCWLLIYGRPRICNKRLLLLQRSEWFFNQMDEHANRCQQRRTSRPVAGATANGVRAQKVAPHGTAAGAGEEHRRELWEALMSRRQGFPVALRRRTLFLTRQSSLASPSAIQLIWTAHVTLDGS